MGKQPREPSTARQGKPSPKRRQSKKAQLVPIRKETWVQICRQRVGRLPRQSATPEPQGKDHRKVGLNSVLSLMTSEELTCPICLEIAVLPTLTDCGHLFCLHCAEDTFITDRTCSVCRGVIHSQQFKQSESVKRLINTYVSCLLEHNDRQEYEQRQHKALQIQSRRVVPFQMLKPGNCLDFRRTRTWHQGHIQSVTSMEVVVSRSIGKSQQHHTFRIDSRQIAYHGTFVKPTITKISPKTQVVIYRPEPLMLIDELSIVRSNRRRSIFEVQIERMDPEEHEMNLPPWQQLGQQPQNIWNLANEERFGGPQMQLFWEVDSLRYDEMLPF